MTDIPRLQSKIDLAPTNVDVNLVLYNKCVSTKYGLQYYYNPDIPKEANDLLFKILCKFIPDIINKFTDGQKAHGGNLLDRDLALEKKQEVIDLVTYIYADEIKKALK